jgi:hypothetical protein
MSGRHVERGRGRGESFALALAFALLLPVLSSAVAPPVPLEEVPGPGPLFNPDDIHTDPTNLAMALIGSTGLRSSGPLTTSAILVMGDRVRTWDLEGVMTSPSNRKSFGAAMLISSGFNPGGSPISQLAMLPIGQSLDFWALQDTNKLLYLTPEELNQVSDGSPIADFGSESLVYSHFLIRSFFTSPAAFKKGVRPDLTYAHLLSDPAYYRGEVVHVEGRLLRINRFRPPDEPQREGVSALYEAWIFNEVFGASPYCVVTTHWPDHLPRSYLGQPKIKEIVRVSADGYFVKTFKYKASDARKTERESPLVVAHSLHYDKPEGPPPEPGHWVRTLSYASIATLGALVLGVFGVSYWYRRNDTTTRRRLMARAPEFVLPTPDAPPPGSPPVAMPVRPVNGIDRSVPMKPRITFPSSGKGEGERGESPGPKEGQPPDEGAGA